MLKSVYALQPYHVGSKKGKSLAIVLPFALVRKYSFNESTVFILRTNEYKNLITLESINGFKKNKRLSKKTLIDKFENKAQLDQISQDGGIADGF